MFYTKTFKKLFVNDKQKMIFFERERWRGCLEVFQDHVDKKFSVNFTITASFKKGKKYDTDFPTSAAFHPSLKNILSVHNSYCQFSDIRGTSIT